MANRRAWDSLSESYKHRLQRKGITEELYGSGASLKAARGHSVTPERPQRAFRNPDLFSDYLRRRAERGRYIPRDVLPPARIGGKSRTGDDASTSPDIGDEIGWAGRDTLDIITFYRSPGGTTSNAHGTMVVTSFNPDGTVASVKQFSYNQGDFYALADLAKQRGYVTTVQSIGPRDMAAIA